MCDNLPDPQALGSQNLNLKESHAPSQTHTLTKEHSHHVSKGEDIGAGKPPQSHSNNNGEDEDTYPVGSRENEEEVEDELMKEEDESEESSGLIRCQSPGTPMTDSSFSETVTASVFFATCATWPSTSAPGPTSVSAPASTTGPIPRPALLAYLEQLERRGDDAHLPQYLHQIAEAFVNQGDYQRAVRCIQLERLYHNRLLQNLNSLQEQWDPLLEMLW
ncbi:unnamed protein product [Merluccius merluccius]